MSQKNQIMDQVLAAKDARIKELERDNERYCLFLKWLAESADPNKLTGEFTVDHARRGLVIRSTD